MYRHPQLDQLLTELRGSIEALYGKRFKHLVLFGSQARSDAKEFSDIDVLVVLEDEVNLSAEIRRTSSLVADISLKYDTVVYCLFVSMQEYEAEATSLIRNIQREGIFA